MKHKSVLLLFLPIGFALLSTCNNPHISPSLSIDAEKIFAFEVFPLLESKCFACHGEDPAELEAEFDMRSLQGMLSGGESGNAALVPNHPDRSPIYFAASRIDEDFSMPPKENDKLDEDQLNSLKQWIAQGAPWPDETRRNELLEEGGWDYKGEVPVATSGGLTDTWTNRTYNNRDIWAFYPLKEVEVPYQNDKKEGNPIDAFIDQKLAEYGLEATIKADKRTLIKRATFDLIGMPPTNAEIDEFLADDREDAFEKVVERLLASPHYGEQWGRHWLDVVRYADSDGFSNDFPRPNAWRYRDYVVRSFNEDKPYNQFVTEQLAGDEIDPENPENLIATGFLRMGPWEHTGMAVEAETRQYWLDDASNNIGEVLMAQPLRCARCHDHKYDPIPTKDVYQVQAVLATTQFADRPAPYLPSENLNLLEQQKVRITSLLEKNKKESEAISKKEEEGVRKWCKENGRKYVPKKERMKLPQAQRPPLLVGVTFKDLGYRKVLGKTSEIWRKEMGQFEPTAFSVYSGPKRVVYSRKIFHMPENLEGEPTPTYILTGGSVYAKSDEVFPGVLSALSTLQKEFEKEQSNVSLDVTIPHDMNRRLAFAKWVTSPDNPLTSRVIVNRIWQYHFGKGIAENSNNFGSTGKQPTHPELLDWLANYFVENGWSIKNLHLLIMSSEAYQRAGDHKDMDNLQRVDPDNHYIAVFSPRRLEAEEIRDAMLASSGELNPEIGGLPVRPEMHEEAALQPRHTMGSIAPAYQPSPRPEQRNRRTIYALRLRSLANPLLEVFDQPTPELSCERRTESTVTPQVFMLFNDQFVRDRSVAIANEIQNQSDESERIENLFASVYNRKVTETEKKKAEDYIEKMTAYHDENAVPRREYPKSVEREMFEEMTGQSFTVTEHLDIYENNYEPDLQMADVSPETRALADLAVVLFNSNEFMYVY